MSFEASYRTSAGKNLFLPGITEALRRLIRLDGLCCLTDGISGWTIISAAPSKTVEIYYPDDPFEVIDSLARESNLSEFSGSKKPDDGEIFPSDPGWIGFLSCEAGRAVEKIPEKIREGKDDIRMRMSRYPSALWVHKKKGRFIAGDNDHSKILLEALGQALTDEELQSIQGRSTGETSIVLDEKSYNEAFDTIADAIIKGDVYQVNLTSGIRGTWNGHPLAFHELLTEDTPPWSAYLDCGNKIISSASPELLVYCYGSNRRVITAPIKGTVPRGKDPQSDLEEIQRLISSEKDMAEHVMIVDLLRNDLGRVCQPGSIIADPLMKIMTLKKIHHLVTEISGKLLPGISPGMLLKAIYPGGSITGAPKVAAMTFIDRLEASLRGVYCGAIGRISPYRDTIFSLPIRTATLSKREEETWNVVYGAGGGIVADSCRKSEMKELILKAERFFEVMKGE